MKKVILLIVIVVAIIFIGIIYLQNNKKDGVINISGNVPLTGDLAVYGEYIRDGAMLAYSDLKDSYPNSSQILFDWQDNRGEIKEAVGIFNRQQNSRPDIYISGLKPQTAAITDLVSKKDIPHFTWILDVKINLESNNNLRNWVNFKKEAEVFVEYLKDKKFEKIYVIYANTDAADEEYEGIVRPALVSLGIDDNNIKSESFNLERTDFKDIALKIKEFNPDYLIINGFIPHLVSMVKDFRVLGIIKDANTIASLDMLDTAPLLAKEYVEGVVVAAPSFLIETTDDLEKWKQHFKDTYNRIPTYHDAYAYDMMKVIFEATRENPNSSEDWIKAIRKVNTEGITGRIEFDEDGSSITQMYPAVYRNGNLVPIKN